MCLSETVSRHRLEMARAAHEVTKRERDAAIQRAEAAELRAKQSDVDRITYKLWSENMEIRAEAAEREAGRLREALKPVAKGWRVTTTKLGYPSLICPICGVSGSLSPDDNQHDSMCVVMTARAALDGSGEQKEKLNDANQSDAT